MIGKIFKRRGNQFLKSSVVYGLGGSINKLLAIFLLPLFTAYLSPEDYGVVAMLTLITTFLTPLFSLGVGCAILPLFYEKNEDRYVAELIWTAILIALVGGSIGVALVVAGRESVSWVLFGKTDYARLSAIACGTAVLHAVTDPVMLMLQLKSKAKMYVALTIVTTAVTLFGSVYFVVSLNRGASGMVEAQFLSKAALLVLTMAVVFKSLPFRCGLRIGRRLIKIGAPFIPTGVLAFLLLNENRYLLQWQFGLDEVGIYSVGFSLGMGICLFVQAFSSAWNPLFMSYAKRDDAETKTFLARAMRWYLVGMGCLTLCFFTMAKPVVTVMADPAFTRSYLAVGLVASSQFLRGLFYILIPPLYYTKKLSGVTVVQAATVPVLGVISVVLIPVSPIMGAATALFLGHLVMCLLMVLWIRRDRSLIHVDFDWRLIGGFSLIFASVAAAFLVERSWPLYWEIGFALTISLLATLGAVFLLLSKSDRLEFMGTLSGATH